MGLSDFEDEAKDILRAAMDRQMFEAWKPIAMALERAWGKGHDKGFEAKDEDARETMLTHLRNYIHREENRGKTHDQD